MVSVPTLAEPLDGLNKSLGNLESQTPKIDLLKIIGVKEEDRAKVQEALNMVGAQFLSAVQGFLQAEQDAARARVQASNQRINELQNDLQAEIALSKTGAASNIQAAKDEIEQQKQLRREAQEDAKKAAKAKLLLDTALQLSSLATATATIFSVTAELNLVPGLGVAIATALSAAMVGAFIASKVKALSAINAGNGESGGFFKGGFTGGSSIYEERGVVHGKEHVMPHEPTAKYGNALLEPLRLGRPEDIDWRAQAMQDLLGYAPMMTTPPALLPNYDVPRQMQQEQQQLVILQQQSFAPLEAKIAGLQGELSEIKKHVAKTANTPQRVSLGDGEIVEFDGPHEHRIAYGPRKSKPRPPLPPGISGPLKRIS